MIVSITTSSPSLVHRAVVALVLPSIVGVVLVALASPSNVGVVVAASVVVVRLPGPKLILVCNGSWRARC